MRAHKRSAPRKPPVAQLPVEAQERSGHPAPRPQTVAQALLGKLRQACGCCPGYCCYHFAFLPVDSQGCVNWARLTPDNCWNARSLAFIRRYFRPAKVMIDGRKEWRTRCLAFDKLKGRCTRYNARPQVCRIYHCAGDSCLVPSRLAPQASAMRRLHRRYRRFQDMLRDKWPVLMDSTAATDEQPGDYII